MLVRDIASLVGRLPDGIRPHSTSPLALDIAIVNNLENNHWDETRQAGGTAYFQYARRERQHNRTEAFCLAAGVQYLPLVWEAQGGCTAETRAFLHRSLEWWQLWKDSAMKW